MMSQLTRIRETFQNHSPEMIAKEIIHAYDTPSINDCVVQHATFFVAPKMRGLYTVEELRRFSQDILDNRHFPAPYARDRSCMEKNGWFYFESVRIVETIGKSILRCEMTLTIEDPPFWIKSHKNEQNQPCLKIEYTKDLRRIIDIIFFPDSAVASRAADFKGGFDGLGPDEGISRKELDKYNPDTKEKPKKGFFARLFG